MPKENVQEYVSALRQRESEFDILPVILADPEVAEAIEQESVEVVCLRLMAAATRVVREDRRTGEGTYLDSHASDLGSCAALLLYGLIPYSPMVVHTKRKRLFADNTGHYVEITDERVRGIFSYPTLKEYDRNYFDISSESPIKLMLNTRFNIIDYTPSCLKHYHGEGNLEDNCRAAETYLKSRTA